MLSSIRTDRSKFNTYLKKYPLVQKELERFTGINKYNARIIFNESHFYKETIGIDTSPYRFLIYRESHNNVNFYFEEALTFIMHSNVYEKTGLSLEDLLKFDYITFKQLVKEIFEATKESTNTMNKVLEKGGVPHVNRT